MLDLRQSSCRMSVLILALVSLNSKVLAQTSGSIYGTVTDASGAVIPGAAVVVTNVHTSASKTTKADASGDYSFLVLDPGDYKVLRTDDRVPVADAGEHSSRRKPECSCQLRIEGWLHGTECDSRGYDRSCRYA